MKSKIKKPIKLIFTEEELLSGELHTSEDDLLAPLLPSEIPDYQNDSDYEFCGNKKSQRKADSKL